MIKLKFKVMSGVLGVLTLAVSSLASPADDYIASKQAHAAALRENAYDNVAYMRTHRDTPQVQSSMSKDLGDLQPAAGGPPTPAPIIVKTPVANSNAQGKSKNN